MSPLDPRSVANAVLSVANEYGFKVTQLSLQKIIYFVHGKYLTENGKPLVDGAFEAWKYGPVHPLIYKSFKRSGSDPINYRADIEDLLSGKISVVDEPVDRDIRLFIREAAVRYLKMSPGQLIDLSHAPKSPWDKVTQTGNGERRYGARISNDDIKSLFRFHKISIGPNTRIGEPGEESPPS
jgi:uncharacterized phage-associated protein